MSHLPAGEGAATRLVDRVRQATGESVDDCYQCGKCTAGCALADDMDLAPNQVLRLLQHGFPEMEEEVLRSYAIWLCLTCQMCVSRCPQEVDLPRIMEHLRSESLRLGKVNPKARDILAFYRSFLGTVRQGGRLFEVGMVADYKLRTGHFLQDVLIAPKLMMRGKLGLKAHKVLDRAGVERIFRRTIDGEGAQA